MRTRLNQVRRQLERCKLRLSRQTPDAAKYEELRVALVSEEKKLVAQLAKPQHSAIGVMHGEGCEGEPCTCGKVGQA